jgi:magnesium chelatase subunit D
MSPDSTAASRRVLKALVCSALEPGLTGVLLFNLGAELIAPVADAFEDVLRRARGRSVRRVTLGAATRDDELWVVPALGVRDDSITVSITPGPLVGQDSNSGVGLVIVPDLVRLSLAGVRASVQVLGADVATTERYGFRARWRPQARWLAICAEDEVGRISPHLLDRFPIRVDAAGLRSSLAPGERVLAAVADRAIDGVLEPLPEHWRAALARSGERPLLLSAEVVGRVIELLDPAPGCRRAIALARLARALATLDGAEAATPDHVEAAARLIGLRTAARVVAAPSQRADPTPAVPAARRQPGADEETPTEPTDRAELGSTSMPSVQPLLEGELAQSFDAFAVDKPDRPGSPYPEDNAAPQREFAPLRSPWQRRIGPASIRGPVIGVRQATTVHDLAFVPTAMEAAKYQRLPIRRERVHADGSRRLVVFPSDLRSYLRSPAPERMLAVILDHSCRKDWDWQDALAPYLRWAYASRATACVVEVGARNATAELRAEKFITRSVLDPKIGRALYRPAGRATPLAHGLQLAAQVLRHAFQHQRSSLVEAWLVVASDGRGNVPLQASIAGQVTGPVGRGGVDDAVAVARDIAAIDRRLHTVVVDAAARPYPELPFALADALGGMVVTGRVPGGVGDAG